MRRIHVHPVAWPLQTDADVLAWKQLDHLFTSYDHRYPPMQPHGLNYVTPTERLEIILCHQSFLVRASDLFLFLEKCPPESLKNNYQLIVDTIFSNRNREQSWDLRSMRRADHPREAAAIFRLLAPDGPLISLALRLMDDHNFLLEFPLDGLPFHLRQKINRMDIPPFFANKVAIVYDVIQQRNVVQHLLLNPFEYYIFCFGAINLLGLTTGRSSDYLHGWAALQDTLYTSVLEDYLTYYFPCDGTGVPLHSFNYNSTDSSVFLPNSLLRQQYPKQKIGVGIGYPPDAGSHQSNSEDNMPRLFKSSILQEQSGTNTARDSIYHATHPSAYKEVWRSETMLHTFMELWMCILDESAEQTESLGCINTLTYGGLPSVEVVKSVRMLVRHMHYFINCVNSHAVHPMEDIKRNSFPIFQKRLYKFLRYVFQYWPLDNSFRIVYETWLSYIQPWRYVNFDLSKNHQQLREGAETPLDRRWFNFFMENILFYSKLFSQMLIRLERIDLSASKNALMFYRVAKILTSHDAVKAMLWEIESQLLIHEKPNSGILSKHPTSRLAGFSYPAAGRTQGINAGGGFFGGGKISPIASSPGGSSYFFQDMGSSAVKIAHTKQLIKELESPDYSYEPLFCEENKQRMVYLLNEVARARDCLLTAAAALNHAKKSRSRTFIEWLTGTTPLRQSAASAAAEKIKSANHLEFAKNQFAALFDIQLDEKQDQTNGSMQDSSILAQLSRSGLSGFESSISINGVSNNSSSSGKKFCLPADVLTDEMTIPLGNPDISLIRSDECRPVVRLMHGISNVLNNIIGDKLQPIYFERSWRGRLARAVLAEPREYYFREPHLRPVKPLRYTRYLPPRVSLRFLGSYYAWCYVFMLLVLGSILNLSAAGWVCLPLSFYMIYLFSRAVSEPVNKSTELYQRYLLSQVVDESDTIGMRTPRSNCNPTVGPSPRSSSANLFG